MDQKAHCSQETVVHCYDIDSVLPFLLGLLFFYSNNISQPSEKSGCHSYKMNKFEYINRAINR